MRDDELLEPLGRYGKRGAQERRRKKDESAGNESNADEQQAVCASGKGADWLEL